MPSPRVLTLTFELMVPEGLARNVRTAKIDRAVADLTRAVQTLVPTTFPYADQLRVSHDWSYRWWEQTTNIALPVTDYNH
jgi:hypothetical protein